jgi:hypothetical protein
VWDGSQGFERSIPFTATLTLRGELASEMRAKKIASSDTEEFSTKLKNMMPGVSNDDLVVKSEQPEEPDGSYTVHFAGTALMDWFPLEGMKGYRYEFDHSVVKWDVEFKRDEENNKNLPVVMQWPFYQRATETIILPKGGKGFKLDAKPIDEHYAGVHVSRTIQQTGDRVIARSEFIHESREIAAADARAASSTIQRLNDEFAYVVAPGRIKAPKQETASK